ncbi:hypothetical protein [Paraburkholderia sp. J12]|uniref:hypothetical protein n=1 Tax=Paraburkholderia sp. J12 TaxID=2805432 RepID=UPI002ABE959A|nr:hypothetical protein [Paraburkholderia sp. J12]
MKTSEELRKIAGEIEQTMKDNPDAGPNPDSSRYLLLLCELGPDLDNDCDWE